MPINTSRNEQRILIVDDNPGSRELLVRLLAPDGYDLKTAAGGMEALAMAASVAPDLILLDVMMPDMNGVDVCRQIRIDTLLQDIPIVMITALDDTHARLRGIEAGADDFISKPFDQAELRARVRNIAELNRYRKLVAQRMDFQCRHLELESAFDVAMEGWVRSLERRGVESVGHSDRVSAWVVELARALQVPAEEIAAMRRGAMLHDIGESVIAEEVLLKPAALSADEWKIVRKHPLYAEELLGSIAFLKPALAIPLHHHERWDGSGYPHGTKGKDIPFAARLFAVVDVWDALGSNRPHRGAWPRHKARAYLQEQAGKLFDPDIVTAFMNLLSQAPLGVPEPQTAIHLAGAGHLRHSPRSLSVIHRGAWGHLAMAAALITGLPLLILYWMLAGSGQGQNLSTTARLAAGLMAGCFMALGYAILAKYPSNIVRLRRYLRELASHRVPVSLDLSNDEDDLTAIRRYMYDLVRQAEERVRTSDVQQGGLLDAERQRVMLESIGAICHHLGQPSTTIGMSLHLMKKHAVSPEQKSLLDECQQAFDDLSGIHDRLQRISCYRTEAYLASGKAQETLGSRILEV
jgi:putative two-component system response regulator